MLALDTNILVHAHRRDAELHEQAMALVRGLSAGRLPWAICFHSLIEFYGVVTHPKLWRLASTPAQALDQIAAWQASPTLRVLCDDIGALPVLAELVSAGRVQGALIHDARIAACCLYSGVATLLTVDRDFGRFPKLRTKNPFVT